MELQARIDGTFDQMMTDHIGRIYLTRKEELLQYDKEGTLRYQYSDMTRGAISQVDTRNPMKIMLFYPDYSQLVYLDNTLSHTQNPIDLIRFGLELTRLACTSFDNGFWVYDPVSFRLVRFDQGLQITNEVENINQLVGADLEPTRMVEVDNWLYMNDPEHGIFVFDSFGTFSRLIPIREATHFQIKENAILLGLPDGFFKYDMLTLQETMIEMPVEDLLSARVEKDRLYIHTEREVLIYRMMRDR